jgi:tetratricopeptide (TPR) repeat protein
MVGTFPLGALGLALALSAPLPELARAGDEPAAPKADRKAADPFGPRMPPLFVPLRPRTAQERDRVEALQDFAAARALENRKRLSDAIELLEEALAKEPDSVAILRRLSLLYRGRGRVEKAVEYSRKVLQLEPDDTEALDFLVSYHRQLKGDPAGAEALLKSVLDNPKLDKTSAAYLLAARELGDLYVKELQQPAKAADAFAKVVEALDQKTANRLSPAELRRLLPNGEAAEYARFGAAFHDAKRYELAIKSFRRGLAYEPGHPLLVRLLALTQLEAGHPAEALATLEPFLQRQPQGREPYELLARILTALKRQDEILPRLEAAAKADPKNLPLQYALADRYRDSGQPQKAEAIYKELVASQPDPQGFGALAASLLKEKKTDELIAVLGDAVTKPGGFEAVRPQIEQIITDPAYAGQVLDAGLKLLEADPPKLGEPARKVLLHIGVETKKFDKVVALQRLLVKREPTPIHYRELASYENQAGLYGEAAATLKEMLAKFPGERNAQILVLISNSHLLAGQFEASIEAGRDALKLNAADPYALGIIGAALVRMGKADEAIAHYKDMLARFPNDDEITRRAHSGLSTLYEERGQTDKGIAELETLLEKYPDDPGVNNDLGYLYADHGMHLEKAEAMVRKAVEAEPENTAYLDSLGWVLFKRGKPKEAVEYLEKAVQDPNVDATICDHLGDVYFQLKQPAKARDAWKRAEQVAAKSRPPDKRLPEIRKKLGALSKLGTPAGAASGEDPEP